MTSLNVNTAQMHVNNSVHKIVLVPNIQAIIPVRNYFT